MWITTARAVHLPCPAANPASPLPAGVRTAPPDVRPRRCRAPDTLPATVNCQSVLVSCEEETDGDSTNASHVTPPTDPHLPCAGLCWAPAARWSARVTRIVHFKTFTPESKHARYRAYNGSNPCRRRGGRVQSRPARLAGTRSVASPIKRGMEVYAGPGLPPRAPPARVCALA